MTAGKIAPETAGEYIVRMDNFAKSAVHKAKKRGAGKDDYKDGLVYQERRELLDGFLRPGSRPWMRRCGRCSA